MGNNITRPSQVEVLYRNGKYINRTTSQLTCSDCSKWLYKPVQTINGHRFCEDCYMNTRGSRKYCRLCKKGGIPRNLSCYNLGEKDFRTDQAVLIDRAKMKTKCLDCGFVGTYLMIKKVHDDEPCLTKPCCL